MGRPINKRNFGTGAGNQLKVRAKIGANAEGDGSIVSQRGTLKFKVTVGANTGDCHLVDKANGALGENEMTITVQTDAGEMKRATKLYNRVAIVDGNKVPWNFDASSADGAVQATEVETGVAPVITLGTLSPALSVEAPATATFTIVGSTVSQAGTLAYQWQKAEAGTSVYADLVGATLDSYTTGATTVLADNGDKYRVVVSATGATSKISVARTLTVTAV
jgi:hypothetical protein